ncbi:MAG: hypothetical protein A2Z91_07530 [Deltaproteobacteria bacterium GWA2_38_16]|nr:MAG: hypothetical protein A2Z91_07530 [Deltaproteobacteria bacterium GWA2_38_16]OGQ03103.1 MAG: hypothetical protein A3D19_03540 [Deltaproteobacteria bacterium RIFCSPHIGHO2_02_FULL_38_15]OGQ31477.1 MAG: hypothetical protein A3A72_01440 [Deltaproteobacteria bacterium RIFCSPLOWO2_01_FULL_38_9]HBQ20478.1 amidohydrolase [Deltaproteobacteria bacterium]
MNDKDIQDLVAWRRDFHAHPELKYQEQRTAEAIQAKLKSFGYSSIQTGIAKTGVVTVLKGKTSRTILLRADMDGLPIEELNSVSYRSKNKGVMHACGHDAHVASLLMVAKHLKNESLNGNIKFVFQPAEEGGEGGRVMVEEGVLKNPSVEAAFGLHVWQNLPVGKIGVTPGPIMAAVDKLEIKIKGKGGHGAVPQLTVDSIVVASHVIQALQTIVSRQTDPLDSAVVTIGRVSGGSAFNIIAEETTLIGTVRTMSTDMWKKMPKLIERTVKGVTSAYGASYELKYERSAPVTINDKKMADFVAEVAASVVGSKNVVRDERTLGGEDFSFMLNEVPGCFFFVGSKNEKKELTSSHHNPHFNIDEACLPLGVEIMKKIAQEYFSYFKSV